MPISKKLKTLALILRSLPPQSQKAIFEQLPYELVDDLQSIHPEIEDQLTEEDWNFFTNAWPEFAKLISSVEEESRNDRVSDLLVAERSKVRNYLDYKLGKRSDKPKLSQAITKIIDKELV